MLTYDDVADLLRLQASAYDLLIWLGRECIGDPGLLPPGAARGAAPGAAADLAHPDTAVAWIERHRSRIPAGMVPPEPRGAFANLLASFFATSFRVEHLEFDNRLVSTRIVLGAGGTAGSGATTPARTGLRHSQALALRHLVASQGMAMTDRQAGDLVRTRRDLRDALLVWTYIWELDRRARHKGKGPVAHRIWREIDPATRRALTADTVWSARQRLLDAARHAAA